MWKYITLSILTIFILSIIGCQKSKNLTEEEVLKIKYPYFASEIRKEKVLTGFNEVKEGMDIERVESLMGKPDEINYVYNKNNWQQVTGISYVYILQRIKAKGSLKEKEEHLIRVIFNLENKIQSIEELKL